MKKQNVITVEYDNDGEMVYAFEEDVNGDFVKDFTKRSDVTRRIKNMILLESGRWDGETSSRLCKAYQGRACTGGGDVEKYAITELAWDSQNGGWKEKK